MPVCCDNQFQSLYKIVLSAFQCCGNPDLDPDLRPNPCDSPETLWAKWGCIEEQCACDTIDPVAPICGYVTTQVQPPEFLVTLNEAGCLNYTLPYSAINLDVGGGVGVFENLDNTLNQFQFRVITSPDQTIDVNLNGFLIELEMNPTETQFAGNLPAVANGISTPISVIVPATGRYLINAHIVTINSTEVFEIYATFPIAQSSNFLQTSAAGKRISLTHYASLTAGPQNVGFVLQTNPGGTPISVNYVIQLVRIG